MVTRNVGFPGLTIQVGECSDGCSELKFSFTLNPKPQEPFAMGADGLELALL